MSIEQQILLLRIQSLIVDKQMCVACANRDEAKGGWLFDHAGELNEINKELATLFKDLEEGQN